MGLELRHVTKKFNGKTILNEVNMEIKDGEFVCIIGTSGCGKTTLLRLISAQEELTGGAILLDNRPPSCEDGDVGFVFQEYALFPWRTVKHNVEFGMEVKGIDREERGAIAQKYIDLVKLSGYEDYYPKELSGGMKQRVGLARALANNPKVLLMDEPFAALDAITRNVMQCELLDIWEKENKTILFVTHSVDEALFLADRVITLGSPPESILEVTDIGIPRHRNRTGTEFNRIRDHLLGMLMSNGDADVKQDRECMRQ